MFKRQPGEGAAVFPGSSSCLVSIGKLLGLLNHTCGPSWCPKEGLKGSELVIEFIQSVLGSHGNLGLGEGERERKKEGRRARGEMESRKSKKRAKGLSVNFLQVCRDRGPYPLCFRNDLIQDAKQTLENVNWFSADPGWTMTHFAKLSQISLSLLPCLLTVLLC